MTTITAELSAPLLIDGAMSTALEQLGADTNNPLWTASVLAKQPELVKRVHQEYFTAGAQLAITDTYQANVPAFFYDTYGPVPGTADGMSAVYPYCHSINPLPLIFVSKYQSPCQKPRE